MLESELAACRTRLAVIGSEKALLEEECRCLREDSLHHARQTGLSVLHRSNFFIDVCGLPRLSTRTLTWSFARVCYAVSEVLAPVHGLLIESLTLQSQRAERSDQDAVHRNRLRVS